MWESNCPKSGEMQQWSRGWKCINKSLSVFKTMLHAYIHASKKMHIQHMNMETYLSLCQQKVHRMQLSWQQHHNVWYLLLSNHNSRGDKKSISKSCEELGNIMRWPKNCFHTTAPMHKTALNFPDFPRFCATTPISKLPGTHITWLTKSVISSTRM